VAGFALMRMFGLMFAGARTALTARASEPMWLVMLPMVIMAGFTLHLPLVLQRLALLPPLSQELLSSLPLAGCLVVSSGLGLALSSSFYLFNRVESPAKLLPPVLNRLLAYDFYTPKVYQFTAIAAVDNLSKLTDWLDLYVVDGLVNLVGSTSLFGGEALKYANSGKMQFYAFTISSFVAAITLYLSWHYLLR
jgi:NAD(P)H-quinone oxidoreductase subunit 5